MQGTMRHTLTISSPIPAARMIRDGSGSVGKTITTNKAFAGTIAAGSVTAVGHNITTSQLVAVFWTDSDGVAWRRYGITAGTVSGNVIPVDSGGNGDVLPTSGTVTICAATILTSSSTPAIPQITGSQMLQFLASCDQWGAMQFFSDAGTTCILELDADNNGEGVAWCKGSPLAIPFTAALAQINAYNASAKAAATWTITALLV
jgi:hypothetical protein